MLEQICAELLPNTKTVKNGVDAEFCNERITEAVELIYESLFESKVCTSLSSQELTNDEEIKRLLDIRTNQSVDIPTTNDDVWIFGYGSLVWKADFKFIDRRCGYITGYQRYFYQHSIDHRGVPRKPGRVVTLIPTKNPDNRVYGMAYRIAANQKNEVLEHLDYREKNGYERTSLTFYEFPESTGVKFEVIMYIATSDNVSYAGDLWQLSLIADQIFTSAGPSGPNREYLFHLATAMRLLFPGVEDKHLFDLEAEVIKRVRDIEPNIIARAIKKEITEILKNCLSNSCNEMDSEAQSKHGDLAVKCIKNLLCSCEKVGWKEAVLARDYLEVTTI